MSTGIERHHQEAPKTPPLQNSDIRSVMEELEAKVATYENQIGQYQNITEDLREENKEIMERYAKLQQFEDLLKDPSKYAEILLKDKLITAKLEARCKEAYGTVSDHLITIVVQECLRQGLLTRWHITKRELERQRR